MKWPEKTIELGLTGLMEFNVGENAVEIMGFDLACLQTCVCTERGEKSYGAGLNCIYDQTKQFGLK